MKMRFNNNQLKLLAMVAMTLDHVGAYLFPYVAWLRIVGRLAFPIFAYMIAEGCRYTRSMGRYLGVMVLSALSYQLVSYFVESSLYQSILVTFSLSVGLIWLIRWTGKTKKTFARVLLALGLVCIAFVTRLLPTLLRGTDFQVDYGLWGVLLPVGIYLAEGKFRKLLCAAGILSLLALESGYLQWYAMLALPLLWMYNGIRGKLPLKWLFYIYYPAHLAVLWLIRTLFF